MNEQETREHATKSQAIEMTGEPLLRVENLKKWFPVRKSIIDVVLARKELLVKAVDGVSFEIGAGEIFGLAGESGSGKTTVGKTILRLYEPTDGSVYFEGKELFSLPKKKMKEIRRKLQTIYQDPYESLDPRMTVLDIVCEPLVVHGIGQSQGEREKIVSQALQDVEMSPPEEFLKRHPHELSGGQRQRVAVARALVLGPQFIVADEPVSMLDVSIRAEVLNLMLKLRKTSGISFLFITHDLALAKHVCDKLAIMYSGKIVDAGPIEEVVNNPVHPYTEALVAAVPVPDPAAERIKVIIRGEIPSQMNPPPGCRFHPRCPISLDICRRKEPELVEVSNSHVVACHVRARSS